MSVVKLQQAKCLLSIHNCILILNVLFTDANEIVSARVPYKDVL